MEAQRSPWLGRVRLVRPLSLSLLSAAVFVLATATAALLFAGHYTRTARLDGVLVAAAAHRSLPRASAVLPAATEAPEALPVAESGLHAVLLAPPAVVSSVQSGQTVRLWFEAVPARTTAHRIGTVLGVSRTPLASEELGAIAGVSAVSAQTLYRVTVGLQPDDVAEPVQPLQAGMRVHGVVLLERRRLVDGLFVPLRTSARH